MSSASFCCPSRNENWCYLCCSVIALRLYFCCCCHKCCKRSGKWASKRVSTLKEALQEDLDSNWEDFVSGVPSDEEEKEKDEEEEEDDDAWFNTVMMTE